MGPVRVDVVVLKLECVCIVFLSWIDLTVFLLWAVFAALLLSHTSLYNLLILGEMLWVSLYVYSSLLSSLYDSLFFFIIAVYMLAIATGETVVGLSLLIVRMSVFGSIHNYDNYSAKNSYFYRKNKINLISSRIK